MSIEDMCVSDLLTPMTIPEIISATADGYRSTMGTFPPAPTLSVITAQECLESGNGKSLHRYAFGNVKWSADWEGLYCMYRCNEIIGGQVKWFDPPNRTTWFRAFLTAAEGTREQVTFLATRDRYRAAWHQIYLGKADAAVRALGAAGYFTANVDAYAKAVVLISGHVLQACADCVTGKEPGLDDTTIAHVEGLVLESLYDPANRDLRLHEDLAA